MNNDDLKIVAIFSRNCFEQGLLHSYFHGLAEPKSARKQTYPSGLGTNIYNGPDPGRTFSFNTWSRQ